MCAPSYARPALDRSQLPGNLDDVGWLSTYSGKPEQALSHCNQRAKLIRSRPGIPLHIARDNIATLRPRPHHLEVDRNPIHRALDLVGGATAHRLQGAEP